MYVSSDPCHIELYILILFLLTEAMFVLINADDELIVEPDQEGLLLYYGETVCDDLFSDNSADAICREMGYPGATSWRYGLIHPIQNALPIGLDSVYCSSDSWDSSCTYETTWHDCEHTEDVHLTCGG